MASLLTNQSAITALQNLTATNRALDRTQARISTGLRVENASDNAAYWSIATTMKSDNQALSSVKDALSLGGATLDVASAAVTSVKDLLSNFKAKLVAALEPGVDRTKIQKELAAIQEQFQSIADSATFSGQNWLSTDSGATGYNATKSILGSFTRDVSGAVSISTIDIDLAGTKLFDSDDQSGILDKDRTVGGSTVSIMDIDISALTDSAADSTTLNEYLSIVDSSLDDTISAAADLGSAKTRIEIQKGFIEKLGDAITTGVGALIDADMNEESTRLQALQTQQALSVQALSIANQSSQSILMLFR